MIIRLATHLGMCFGVRDAIQLANQTAAQQPLTILGDLVHNPGVLQDLRARGVDLQSDPDQVKTHALMITAHGTSDGTRSVLARQEREIIDATCPLVHHAHRQLLQLVAAGCFPIVIGVHGHTEVKGLVGDLDRHRVVLSELDVDALPEEPHFGIVAQTTQPIGRVLELLELIRKRHPQSNVTFRDTVCQPTKQRQLAAAELATESDVMIVVGGGHSNNTRELARLCAQHCRRVHHVQFPEQLQFDWFLSQDRVGITAGTSTPDDQIQNIVRHLEAWTPSFAQPAVAPPELQMATPPSSP